MESFRAVFAAMGYVSVGHQKAILSMKMSNFNCVELKHRGAEKVIEETSKMTPTQELEFWRERTQNLINQKESIEQKRNQRVNAQLGVQ